jgi:alkylation response protein AidB-like acyl-CoA dehydrogenase
MAEDEIMHIDFSDEQRLIQQTAKKVASEAIAPKAHIVDKERVFPDEGLKVLAEAGLLGMVVPPELGGSGADSLSYVLTLEELAKACASTALVFFAHTVATTAIVQGLNEHIQKNYLPSLITGNGLAVTAHTEPNSGVNNLAIESTARFDGEHYIINGSKHFITSASEANYYVVWAKTNVEKGARGISLILVDKDAPGFSFGRKNAMMGLRGSGEGELIFEDCRVPKSNLLGDEGGGLKIAVAYSETAFLGAGAISLGIAQATLEASIQYAKNRVIAGKPIGSFQGIQFFLAEMHADVSASRSLIYSAAILKDRGSPKATFDTLQAKYFASETAIEVTNKALQIHGGHGYTEELPIERYLRDARGMTLHVNTTEVIKERLGKLLLD